MKPPVFSCSLTFSLSGGQVATQFLTTPGPAAKPLAITGGTGIYRDVRGEGTLVEFGQHKGSITLHLTGTKYERLALSPGQRSRGLKPATSGARAQPLFCASVVALGRRPEAAGSAAARR